MEMGNREPTHRTRSSHSRAVEGLLPLTGTHPAPHSPPHVIPTPSSDYSARHFPNHRADCFVGCSHGGNSFPWLFVRFVVGYLVLRLFDGLPPWTLTSKNTKTVTILITNTVLELASILPGTQQIHNQHVTRKSTNPILTKKYKRIQ